MTCYFSLTLRGPYTLLFYLPILLLNMVTSIHLMQIFLFFNQLDYTFIEERRNFNVNRYLTILQKSPECWAIFSLWSWYIIIGNMWEYHWSLRLPDLTPLVLFVWLTKAKVLQTHVIERSLHNNNIHWKGLYTYTNLDFLQNLKNIFGTNCFLNFVNSYVRILIIPFFFLYYHVYIDMIVL